MPFFAEIVRLRVAIVRHRPFLEPAKRFGIVLSDPTWDGRGARRSTFTLSHGGA